MDALTYTTLTGEVVDLTGLTEEQRAFFDYCYERYRSGMAWGPFTELVSGTANPVVRELGRGRINHAVWEHPLFRAVRDLEDRVGITHGDLEPDPGTVPEREPLGDEWIPTAEAARRKGVTFSGLDQAINRGEVVARPAKPGGKRRLVSVRSLERWQPNPARQAAKRRTVEGEASTR
ncbi:MAG: hypothetical protein HY689_06905 [Chloroflexi bacterium]|nr:hypothetical protein [Chloroflexota bacterium]